jgi:ATPase subunit of ABC transporter with duplicated ATPase domains
MNIKILKAHRALLPGKIVPVHLNKVNYWVGANGCGKTSLIGELLNEFPRAEHYWNAASIEKGVITIEDKPKFDKILLSSPKLRQVQMADLNVVMDMGIERLHASDGQNNVADMMNSFREKDNPNILHIFDELDSHLDYKNKCIFFTALLPQIKGTVILTSHDSLFLTTCDVFDFTDYTQKKGLDYYSQQTVYPKKFK